MWRGSRMVLVVVLAGALRPTTVAGEVSVEWCEAQWARECAPEGGVGPSDYVGLLNRWQGYAVRCAGTGAYEARLAMALAFNRRFDLARRALEPVRDKKTSHAQLVALAPLVVD